MMSSKEYLRNDIYIEENTKSISSKTSFYLQIVFFGLIILFLSIEYPSFHFQTSVSCKHWIKGYSNNYHNMVILSYPTDIIIIIMSIFSVHHWKRFLLKANTKYLMLFIISSIISLMVYSPHISQNAYYKIFNLILLTSLFSLIHYILTEDTEKKISFFFHCILAVAIFQAIIACIQYFTQAKAGISQLETTSLFESTFKMPDKKLWLFDNIFSVTRSSARIARVYGSLTNTNVLGGFILFSSFFSFYLFFYAKKWWQEIIYGSIIFIQFFTICITYSRAAIISYFLGSTLWFAFFFTKQMKKHKNNKKLINLSIWVTLSIIICFILFYNQFFHRGGIVNYNKFVAVASDLPRYKSMYIALKIIQCFPFFGIGFENYASCLPTVSSYLNYHVFRTIIVHNIYVLIAVETGIIGISFFLLFIGTTLKKALLNITPITLTLLVTFIGLLFIGGCDFYLWRFPSGRLMFFITAGFLSALSSIQEKTHTYNKEINTY